MPIHFVRPSADVLDALARGLDLSDNPAPQISWSHPVYTLSIEDVRQQLWRPIGPIGLRVLEVDQAQITSAYEVSAGPDGTPRVNHRTVDGPFLSGTLQAIEEAERLAGDRDYEFRLLRASFLHFVAAWLYSAEADAPDIILPISPQPTILPERASWSPNELMPFLLAISDELDPKS